MLCDNCKKEIATTHIKTVINGKVYEKYLCMDCYNKENSHNDDITFGDIFLSMLDNKMPLKSNDVLHCPVCGSTIQYISKSGKVGCSKCYEVFGEQLLPYIKRIHGNTKHIGKKIDVSNKKTVINETETLKEKMQKYINEENFEEAAKIRDKIKELEGRE